MVYYIIVFIIGLALGNLLYPVIQDFHLRRKKKKHSIKRLPAENRFYEVDPIPPPPPRKES